ncbi:uncharacterized protein K02A2.6-like [Uranotaenia lowii]|uniref:uncharacterized protein K02A2.6-like n=1 Tax=Uranotaenia lowii TaxID=190385 RepID=UPI00247A6E55|nr:uncharacterized protein K02A2.6-like [Uranotaenia lowii]
MSIPGMIGTMDHFQVGKSFSNYIERFEILCGLNKVTEETKKSWFISLSGDDVFDEIKLIFPKREVKDLTYDEIIAKLKTRFDKTEPVLMNRYKFYNREQGANESAENFVLAVKLMAESCNFRDFKDEAIRDRLIIGLANKDLQFKLLLEDDIGLNTLENKIINNERALGQAKLIGEHTSTNADVLSIKHRLGRKEYFDSERKFQNKNEMHPRRFRSRSFSRDRGSGRRNFHYDRRANRNQASTYHNDWNFHSSAVCNNCRERGHIRRNCPHFKNPSVKFVENVDKIQDQSIDKFDRLKLNDNSDDSEVECLMISAVNNISDPCIVNAKIDGRVLKMEIDTGSAVTVISYLMYNNLFRKIPLVHCNKKLAVVNGARLVIAGQILTEVFLNGFMEKARLIVLKNDNDFKPLIGRDWLKIFYPNWKKSFINHDNELVNNIVTNKTREETIGKLKAQFASVFDKDFSKPILGHEADLHFKPEQPIFKKAYQVPYKIKEKFLDHLTMLEGQGVITPIESSEWASPVIAIVKKDGGIRMVIDCKVSLNKILIQNTYPLPLAQDIFASLAGCKVFCSLDLSGAYTQLQLSKRSRKYVVINTEKGLFTYNRLPQGASSSTAVFQNLMEKILKGIKNVNCYLDDVLIAGKTFEECLDKLIQVLNRLVNANISVNYNKCKFFVDSLPYLGHLITKDGLRPSPEKISTIAKAKAPENVTELKAYLGLINYYNRFIPNLSSKLRCLYDLLKKNTHFNWTEQCNQAFLHSKNTLLNANILDYYDPKKSLVVITDASTYGLGGVLAQIDNGVEKPVCFTSFSLNSAQQKYPILHLEALALVCVIKKFHKFLFGQPFVVYTDHKPLLGIFGKEGKHSLYVTRLQRYLLELSIYNFEVRYRPGHKMGNADFCSRFPLEQKIPSSLDQDHVYSINFSSEMPLNFCSIAKETSSDKCLSKIIEYLNQGWPKKLDMETKEFHGLKSKLHLEQGVLLMDGKVIIPSSLKDDIMNLLHSNHEGIIKMKKLARKYVYWRKINEDIENFVKCCATCAKMETKINSSQNEPWTPTTRPFSRLHADFFHFDGSTFLLIIDSFSKWLEIDIMSRGTNAKQVIKKFSSLFSRFGLPDVVVTDGGPPFNSGDFVMFLEKQGIKVLKSPPYHPQSNGQAERMVRVTKDILKKFLIDPKTKSLDLDDRLSFFLMNYRNSFIGQDSIFPTEKVLSYQPKLLLDLLNPCKSYKNNLSEQPKKKYKFDHEVVPPQNPLDKLLVGDMLYYRNPNRKDFPKWLEAKFIKKMSKNIFQISIRSHVLSAHRDQLKPWHLKKRSSMLLVGLRNSTKRTRMESSDEEDFFGYPAEELKENLEVVRPKKKPHVHERSPILTRSRTRYEECA